MPENLPQSLLKIRSSMLEFIDQNLTGLAAASSQAEEERNIRDKVILASQKAGFYYKTQAAVFGGQPASALELTLLREMLAAANTRFSEAVFGPGPGILHGVEGRLKQTYLDPLLHGEKRTAFGFTEAEDAERATYGIVEGEQIFITGQKSYVTGGAEADFVSILVNLEGADGSKLGTAMVVVDVLTEGVSIERHFTSLDGSGHVAMRFVKARVPKGNIIGKPGEGMPRALGNIGNVRLMVAAQAMGMCLWVLNFVEDHLKAPHRSGSPLGDKEAVRLRFADMRMETYVARSALYRTARIVDSGVNSVNEVITCKVFCTETASRVVDTGLQLIGGQALVEGHPMAALYRQVRSLRLVEGANDLLRLNLAKGKLKLNKGSV